MTQMEGTRIGVLHALLWSYIIIFSTKGLEDDTLTCAQEKPERTPCGANRTESICLENGCWWCPGLTPTCTRASVCNTTLRRNCWGGNIGEENADDCRNVYGCSWCPDAIDIKCLRGEPNDSRTCQQTQAERSPCKALGNETVCLQNGCWWCGGNIFPKCTKGKACSESVKVNCWGGNPGEENANDCRNVYGCSWCPDSDIKCLYDLTDPITATMPSPTTASTTVTAATTKTTTATTTATTTMVSATAAATTIAAQPITTTAGLECPTGERHRYKQETCCAPSEDSIPDSLLASGIWPWMAGLYVGETFKCGAVLVDKQHVLTSAKCVEGQGPNIVLRFRTNETDVQSIPVSGSPIIHYEYNSRFKNNDLAIIKLSVSATLNNYTKPISLPRGEQVQVESKCFTLKWTQVGNIMTTPKIIDASVDISQFIYCATAYATHPAMVMKSTEMLCAAATSEDEDFCEGGSAGPLVCQRCSSCSWFLAGIETHVGECGNVGYPGVYTRIKFYEDWITGSGVEDVPGIFNC